MESQNNSNKSNLSIIVRALFSYRENEDEFLSACRVPRALGTYVIIAFFLTVFVFGAFFKIDGGIFIPGRVVNIGSIVPIQIRAGGIIDKVMAKDGDQVSEGQVILTLDSKLAQAKLSDATMSWCHLILAKIRLSSLLEGRESMPQLSDNIKSKCFSANEGWSYEELFNKNRESHKSLIEINQKKIKSAEKELFFVNKKLPLFEKKLTLSIKDLEHAINLANSGFLSKHLVESYEKNKIDAEIIFLDQKQRATLLQLALEQLRDSTKFQEEVYRQDLQKELIATKEQFAVAESALAVAQNEINGLEIRATVSGAINGVNAKNVGTVVAPGQILAEIVRHRGNFIVADGIVPTEDMSFFFHKFGNAIEAYNRTSVENLFPVSLKIGRSSFGRRCPDLVGYVFYVSPSPIDGTGYKFRIIAPKNKNGPAICQTMLDRGSPVDLMIKTYSRTPLNFIFGNLFDRMFREG